MVTRTIRSYLYRVTYIDAIGEVFTAETVAPKFRLKREEAKEICNLDERYRVIAVVRVKEVDSFKYAMSDEEFLQHAKVVGMVEKGAVK